MEKLINEENEWDRRILAGVKERPAICIRIGEASAALTTTTTATTTTAKPFYDPFVRAYPGELVPEETFTHSHLS